MSKETNKTKFKIINLELAEKALTSLGEFLIKESTDWVKRILNEDKVETKSKDTSK